LLYDVLNSRRKDDMLDIDTQYDRYGIAMNSMKIILVPELIMKLMILTKS